MDLYNKKDLYTRRKELRSKATAVEIVLWHHLKLADLGYKFRRQYSVGYYILDFYCPEKRLGIEADGRCHDIEYDKVRDHYLKGADITIIRFTNSEILENTKAIINKIRIALENK